MYKFETHLHTKNCSACAVSSGVEMVDAAKEKGYSGFVITNHFYHGNTCIDRNLGWEDFIGAYKEDYDITRDYGAKNGIQVFFGIEEGFATGKEMLIYGIMPEIFIKHPEFIMMNAKEKSDFVHANGGITICAHPFRKRSYIPDPDCEPDLSLFDGIEGYNCGNAPDENTKALAFALENRVSVTSGGDVHKATDFGKAGIEFTQKVNDYNDFIRLIKNKDFSLIIP